MKLLFSLILFCCILLVQCSTQEPEQAAPHGKLTSEENMRLQKTCGHYDNKFNHKSINSERVQRNVAPWVVAVSKDASSPCRFNFNSVSLRCSGVLISPRHVLSAKHCFSSRDRKYVWIEPKSDEELKLPAIEAKHYNGKLINLIPKVVLEENAFKLRSFRFVFDDECGADLTRDGSSQCSTTNATLRRAVKAFFPRMLDIEFSSGSSDLVVFELDEPVHLSASIYPACLSGEIPTVGNVLDLYSFGQDGKKLNESSAAGTLQHISVTVVPCLKLKSPDAVCTRSDNQTAFHGDSGGPFIYMVNNTTYVTAVVSGASGFTENYSDYVQTGVALHLAWICKHVGICADHPKEQQTRQEIEIVDFD